MRPVSKGAAPRQYTRYGQAQADLVQRLGDYCNYCERQIETHLAVEHVRPKSLQPDLELEWNNFLLGCVNCNSCKGDTAVNLDDFLWPDHDNTMRAFGYSVSGIVGVVEGLDPENEQRAMSLLRLVGLDKWPGHADQTRVPPDSDRRWFRRHRTWQQAVRCRELLQDTDTEAVREIIASKVVDVGMFSIWFAVFAGDPDMQQRFIQAQPGTAGDCFDAQFDPVARPGGFL